MTHDRTGPADTLRGAIAVATTDDAGGPSRARIRAARCPVFAGTALLLAVAAAGGCHAVTVAPESAAWTVVSDGVGESDHHRAVWSAGPVSVVVPLRQPSETETIAADVWNDGLDVARLTFTAPRGRGDPVHVGTVSGSPPSFDREWSADVFTGRPVDVPAGVPGRPGSVRLAIRPDPPRTGSSPLPVGTRFTLDLTVTNAAGSASCPVRFRVTGSADDGWEGLSATGRALVVLVLAAATAGLILWLG